MTESDKVLIRGAASDDKNKITSVKVNGYDVSTTDNYSTWQVEVPVSMGKNTLSVSTSDSVGNTSDKAAEIQVIRKILLINPTGIAVDVAKNRALVIDAGLKALIAVDLVTSIPSVLSDNLRNDSTPFSNPVCITLDAKNNRALILDDGFGVKAIVSVNLSTGQRATIAKYPDKYGQPTAIALDESKNRILFTGDQSVVEVDLSSGAAAVVSDHSTPGTQYYLTSPKGIVIDSKNNRALITDTGTGDALVYIDLSPGPTYGVAAPLYTKPENSMDELVLSGDKNKAFIVNTNGRVGGGAVTAVELAYRSPTILSDNKIPNAQYPLTSPYSIALDEAHNRLLVLNGVERSILTVDLASGQRSVLSDNSLPTGKAAYITPTNLVVDDANHNLLLMDEEQNTLFAVDINTGIHSIISAGPHNLGLHNYHGIVLDKARKRALIADGILGGIVSIDMTSGERSMFWTKNNIPAPYPFGIALDSTKNKIWVNDAYDCVFAIDLMSGISSLLSNNTTPNANNPMSCMSEIALDVAHNRLLSAETVSRSIIAIDLTTGDRTILSSNSVPDTSNPFLAPNTLTIDVSRNRALVLDSLERIVFVDLSTGVRTPIPGEIPKNNPYESTISIDQEKNIAYLIDSALDSVVVVDLVTGQRAIFSK